MAVWGNVTLPSEFKAALLLSTCVSWRACDTVPQTPLEKHGLELSFSNCWSHSSLPFFKLVGAKECLFLWLISVGICSIRNEI